MSSEAQGSASTNGDAGIDLVGGPFAVVESDPGVFTSIIRGLGIQGIEVEELYSLDPWAIDHVRPYAKGLIFCFPHQKDFHLRSDFSDPASEGIWFANQLSDDACATQAILNILLNVDKIYLGEYLTTFKQETAEFDAVMKGLAIANSPLLRRVHNSVARPADIEAAWFTQAKETLRPSRTKKTKLSKPSSKPKSDELDAFHFIGYIPWQGKVWELDGLKRGPLEVMELDESGDHWIDVIRPVLRVKMAKYGGADEEGDGSIRFNLLAIVEDKYEARSDDLELIKRKKAFLEKHMGEGWQQKVDPSLLSENLTTSVNPSSDTSVPFSSSFGLRAMEAQTRILGMDETDRFQEWNTVVREGLRAKIAVQEEIDNAIRTNTEEQKRTFDYGPFIRRYITLLQEGGLLEPLIESEIADEDKKPVKSAKSNKNGKSKQK